MLYEIKLIYLRLQNRITEFEMDVLVLKFFLGAIFKFINWNSFETNFHKSEITIISRQTDYIDLLFDNDLKRIAS